MPQRVLAALLAVVLAAVGAVAVSGTGAATATVDSEPVSSAKSPCPRGAIDRATPGRLLTVRCADGLAAGKTRHKGARKAFLVKLGGADDVRRLTGTALSATCVSPGLSGSLADVAPCNGLREVPDCEPFPAGDVPPDPNNPNPPYGDPRKASSLTSMRNAVLGEAERDTYSKNAVLCAEHPDDETPEDCDVAYWNPGGLPGARQECNFFYLRVGNEYWTGLTPMILNQYGEYLGVSADGTDTQNQHAGPHTSIATYNSSQAWLQAAGKYAATFGLVDGTLSASDVQRQLEKVLGNDVVGNDQLISPVLFHDRLDVDCTPAWQGGGRTWQQVKLSAVPVAAGTSFTCTATAPGAGTAYVTAKLGPPASDSVPGAVNIIVDSDKSNTLRKVPNGPFDADNTLWPNGLAEVVNEQAVPFSVDVQDTCLNDKTGTAESCLHLWANPVFQKDRSGTPTPNGCQLWFVMEIRSPQLLAIMDKYGLGRSTTLMRRQLSGWGLSGKELRNAITQFRDEPQKFTPLISLAKRKYLGSEVPAPWGYAPAGTRDVCTDASLLGQGKDAITPFVPTPSN